MLGRGAVELWQSLDADKIPARISAYSYCNSGQFVLGVSCQTHHIDSAAASVDLSFHCR